MTGPTPAPSDSTSRPRKGIPTASIGTFVLALFGLAWWLGGAIAIPGTAGTVLVTLGVLTTAAILTVGWRRAPRYVGGPIGDHVKTRFNRINATQWGAIIAIVAVARLFGVPSWIPALVVIIVGIHFLPLATLFHWSAYRATACLLIAIGAIGLTLAITGTSSSTVQILVGLPAALTLWATTASHWRHPVTANAS
jgi:hypothetical protein